MELIFICLLLFVFVYGFAVAWMFGKSEKQDAAALFDALQLKSAPNLTISGLTNDSGFIDESNNLVGAYSTIALMYSFMNEIFADFCIIQMKFCEKGEKGVFDNLFISLIQQKVAEKYGIITPVYVYESELQGAVVVKKFNFAITENQLKALENWKNQQLNALNPTPPVLTVPEEKKN